MSERSANFAWKYLGNLNICSSEAFFHQKIGQLSAFGDRTYDPLNAYEFNASSAIVPITILLHDHDAHIRHHAAVALAKMGDSAVPLLVGVIRESRAGLAPTSDPELRFMNWCYMPIYYPAFDAAVALGMIRDSTAASAMVPLLAPGDSGTQKHRFQDGIKRRSIFSKTHANKHFLATGKLYELGDSQYLESSYTQNYALLALQMMGETAVPTLSNALKKADPTIRTMAAVALGKIGPAASGAVPLLASALHDPDAKLRKSAAKALYLIGPSGKSILAAAVQYGDADIRNYIIDMHPDFGDDGQTLQLALKDIEPSIRSAAARAAAEVTVGQSLLVAPLMTNLSDQTATVREEAAYALRVIAERGGVAAARISPALLHRAMLDEDASVRAEIASALVALSPPDEKTAQVLSKDVDRSTDDERTAVINALGRVKLHREVAASTLLRLLRETHEASEKYAIVSSLGALGADASPAVRDLLYLSTSTDTYMRSSSDKALAEIGTSGLEALLSLSTSLDQRVVVDAIEALGWVTINLPKNGKDALIAALRSPIPDIRNSALSALKSLGPRAAFAENDVLHEGITHTQELIPAVDALTAMPATSPAAIAFLLQIVQNGSPNARAEAASALGKSRLTGQHAAVLLLDALPSTSDTTISVHTWRGMKYTGYSGQNSLLADAITPVLVSMPPTDVIPPLRDLLRRKPTMTLLAVTQTLGAAASDAVPELMPLLRHPKDSMRAAAATALAAIAPHLSATSDSLTTLLSDPSMDVRNAAADALVRIGAKTSKVSDAFLTIATDNYVSRLFDETFYHFSSRLKFCMSGEISTLPKFPWPPPPFSTRTLINSKWLGSDTDQLEKIYQRISGALATAGFTDIGLFGVSDGFAIVTRMERIMPNGTSSPPPNRWTDEPIRANGLMDYLGQLFLEKPGLFRLIVFSITNASIEQGKAALSEDDARTLFMQGGLTLPTNIATLNFKGRKCYAIIYEFSKLDGVSKENVPSALTTVEHLQRAGVWVGLIHAY